MHTTLFMDFPLKKINEGDNKLFFNKEKVGVVCFLGEFQRNEILIQNKSSKNIRVSENILQQWLKPRFVQLFNPKITQGKSYHVPMLSKPCRAWFWSHEKKMKGMVIKHPSCLFSKRSHECTDNPKNSTTKLR